MRIACASGKGGTGKTTLSVNLAVAFAAAGEDAAYVDCDVEEPNGHLFLHPTIHSEQMAHSPIPEIIPGACTGCGECQTACQFNAILALEDSVMVFETLCHGCGACLLACPEHALVETPRPIGLLRLGRADELRFLDAQLTIGEARATPLISAVRDNEPTAEIVIADAPPGATCPTMEAIRESDLVLLAAEPTPFGLHDLKVVQALCEALALPTAAVINREDLGDDRVREFCETRRIPILDALPYDPAIAAAGAAGRPIALDSGPHRALFEAIGRAALELAGQQSMKQWVVTSGKGGTGKTSLVAAFARLAGRLVLADADVDAANLALGLDTRVNSEEDFHSGSRVRVDEARCTGCGECLEVCRYDALSAGCPVGVDLLACEGCKACVIACPEDALSLVSNHAGQLLQSETAHGPLIHAELGIAQDNSGKLVAAVVERARACAVAQDIDLVLVDGPPGIACPVHAALSGADRLLAVTEPSASGLHDLGRLLELAAHFKIESAVAINRWDVSAGVTEQIEARCREGGVPVLGRVPFDRGLPAGLCKGEHPLDAAAPETAAAIRDLWQSWAGDPTLEHRA